MKKGTYKHSEETKKKIGDKNRRPVILICKSCSKNYVVSPTRMFKSKYCSNSCRLKNFASNRSGAKISAEQRSKISVANTGEKNWMKGKVDQMSPHWKGEQVTYSGLHHWIKKKLGSPKECKHCGNTKLRNRQYNWANVSQQYKRDIEDWIRLCVKCHRKYDFGTLKNKPSFYEISR